MAAAGEFDLDAYFARIEFTGDCAPTLDTLTSIAYCHALAIPFENLYPFLGQSVSLDLSALQRKLVDHRRGGWCFEHNLLLREALLALGYEVTALAARVLWGGPPDRITPRSHMLLRVGVPDDPQPYLVDVGFGGMTPTSALLFSRGVEQTTPHEPFRVGDIDGDFTVEALVGDAWVTLYRFDLTPQYPVDYEAANWYLSTHPSSHFVNGLTAARPAADRRYALNNRRLNVHHLDGTSERHVLGSADELIECLRRDFHIELDNPDPLRGAFDRIPND
ncbi:arylamine N-acetyltransferase [Skermania sp. ID1734]|nr:arylamine N-acetyltransferase [Skermania sp. ID1734]